MQYKNLDLLPYAKLAEMTKKKISDIEAKAILLKWPGRTKKLWPAPDHKGYWVRGQPKHGNAAGPRISSPGAKLFTTQPDGLWVHFDGTTCCDVVAIEVCGTVQNLNDKRSRYIPASHSLVVKCLKAWFAESITVQKGGSRPLWKATASISEEPQEDLQIPIRHLRILYALPNKVYDDWAPHHTPTGYEYFCLHSSLDSYQSGQMQTFLRQMSMASRFYRQPKKSK